MSQKFFHKKDNVSEEDIQRLLGIFKRIQKNNVWSKVTKEDFTVGRFEVGLGSDICHCILTEDAQRRFVGNCSPTGIVVKIFPSNSRFTMNDIHKGILCSMVADNNLGPKLIYMDQECSINEYISGSRHHLLEDDEDEEFVKKVMRYLARYHNLQVPISDTYQKDWLDRRKNFFSEFPGTSDVWNGKYLDFMDENPDLKPLREVFENFDFKFNNYLAEAQHKTGSPVVFSHMDFHRNNRLVRETTLPNGKKTKELYIVDLDASLYAYRGYDLGSFFDSLYGTEPYFGRESFASDDVLLKFIEEYRQECAKIVGKQYLDDKVNSSEQILRESKFFVLNYAVGMSFFCCVMFAHNPKDPVNIEKIIAAHKRLILIQKLRERFAQEGILPDV